MNFQRAVPPNLIIADQPTATDLEALQVQGFVGIVNLRNDGEPEQPISTTAEAEKAKALGLDYIHMGVGSAPLLEQDVDRVCRFIDDHKEGKILVHCRKGGRAAAVALLYNALSHGWQPAETAAKGKEIGLDVDGNLRTMVETYLDDHRQRQ
jgi:uncharacterized protein (TIGR01244 family)